MSQLAHFLQDPADKPPPPGTLPTPARRIWPGLPLSPHFLHFLLGPGVKWRGWSWGRPHPTSHSCSQSLDLLSLSSLSNQALSGPAPQAVKVKRGKYRPQRPHCWQPWAAVTRDPESKRTPALWPGLRYPQASQISEAESASCFPDSRVTRASWKKKKGGGFWNQASVWIPALLPSCSVNLEKLLNFSEPWFLQLEM